MSREGLRPFGYERLMPNLVKDVLLVASPYDRFILEEDGRFADRLFSQYAEMDLAVPPRFDHAPAARVALERLDEDRFDLVLTTPHCADLSPLELAARVRERHPGTPVAMLTYDRADALTYSSLPRSKGLDQVFLWTGDPRLLVTLIKSVEDLLNVDHDTEKGRVRVIVVVEDSPAFYSSYLPLIYTEVLTQVQALLAERLNERDRAFRRRARPKILLARNFEEGEELVRKYQRYLLGTICDMRFPRLGQMDPDAGLRFIRLVRAAQPDVPVLLQSSQSEHASLAAELKVHFADKSSPDLLQIVRTFIRKNFGFGSFVFVDPTSLEEVDRADDLPGLLEAVRRVPPEVLRFHAAKNHVSNWLMARAEFELALEVRPKKVSDFDDTEAMRRYLAEVFSEFLEREQRGEVAEFDRSRGAAGREFTLLGSGSMGGKARGIAFIRKLLAGHPVHAKYPNVRIFVPRTTVLCTDLFERFVEAGGLGRRALDASSDEEIVRLFLAQPLAPDLMEDLAAILAQIPQPLAVRSSSLQEDSESQPLAGLFKTFMLPNSAASPEVRLVQLSQAVRLIFACVFATASRNFLEAHSMRVEEEKMAVILQRMVGRRHGEVFYPDFAGVAQSYNFYPIGYVQPKDGIATVALGLGQTIVEGRRALRFSPRYPGVLPQMPDPATALRTTQRDFYALDLTEPERPPSLDDRASLVRLPLEEAERHGTLEAVGATYSAENNAVYDTIYRPGTRLVTFAGVLKHGRFPLAPLLEDLLALGEEGMGTAVEMEFAVSLGEAQAKPELAVLQLRPLVARGEVEVELGESGAAGLPLLAGPALGNGVWRGVRDVVYVHPQRLDLARSRQVADALERINHRLEREQRPYLLLGPGRWGTADPWLGIPVGWRQVAGAVVICELQVPGLRIDPSQGTHFFHNLMSLRLAYFSIDVADPGQLADLAWLESLPAEEEIGQARHVRLAEPLAVAVDGRVRRGLVVRT